MDEKNEMNGKQAVVDIESLELSPAEKKFLLQLKQEIKIGIAS